MGLTLIAVPLIGGPNQVSSMEDRSDLQGRLLLYWTLCLLSQPDHPLILPVDSERGYL